MSTGTSGNIKIGTRTGRGWVFGAKGNFGVTQDGALYASEAYISGISVLQDGVFFGSSKHSRIYDKPTGISAS